MFVARSSRSARILRARIAVLRQAGWKPALRVLALLLGLLILTAADGAAPRLQLEATMPNRSGLPEFSRWGEERLHRGIGWTIATTVRGGEDQLPGYARRGYTVISPQQGTPKPLRHFYVLAAFDLLPAEYLLIAVRDPELHWPVYDPEKYVRDTVEMVWFDRNWNEVHSRELRIAPDQFPDDFRLSPDEKYLVAITHPLNPRDPNKQAEKGSALWSIRLKDGEVRELGFPDQQYGVAPATWWPLRMTWDREELLAVQAGDEVRRYSLKW